MYPEGLSCDFLLSISAVPTNEATHITTRTTRRERLEPRREITKITSLLESKKGKTFFMTLKVLRKIGIKTLQWPVNVSRSPRILRFLRLSRAARWRGPSAKKYVSVTWSCTSRFPRPLGGHLFTHWESGSVELHTITWQWTNTEGWSAMNLKASKLNRCELVEGEEWYWTVSSVGHLRENFSKY